MNNNYQVIKNIEKIKNGECTKFLDFKIQKELKNKLKKNEYNIYYPYIDAEKIIFYKNKEPNVCLLEILCKQKLNHREILGSVFSLGLDSSVFGDIIILDDHYYIYVLEEIKNYILNNLLNINKNDVILVKRDLNILENYKREYMSLELVSSSERIDTIIAHLINVNRVRVKKLINDKNIILNCDVITNSSKKLVLGDIISIRKYGKYKYMGIINKTKSGNYVIKIDKYV